MNINELNVNDLFQDDDDSKKELDQLLDEARQFMSDWDYDNESMTPKLRVSFINKSVNPDPSYEKEGDSGFDIRASVTDKNSDGEYSIEILPGNRCLIKTGLYFEIPLGFELQVRSRSGLALKNGIMVLNSPGTVDSGYRGEIGVILYNTDQDQSFFVKNGDRIAQGVIAPVQTRDKIKFIKSESLSSSDRGLGGFGSTGIL
jgi:dUTP pyrophosphatase